MRRTLIAIGLIVIALAIVAIVLTWRPALDPVEPVEAAAFDPELVERGAQLATLGNCAECHTVEGGATYAGGYPLETPFGTIYGTNITPEMETGIGTWSEAAFFRAMREGVDREGRHLYPGFPYDQFTLLADEDLRALYAYFMTREPVRYKAPAPDVPFPLNLRPILAGWKLLYLDDERFASDTARNENWNRGAYLTDALAHCGACHTPRNILGARTDDYLGGGESEGWHAPPLNQMNRAPLPWTEAALRVYLGTGTSAAHATAAGPMAPVVRSLSHVTDEDVAAIAHYIADVMGAPEEPGQIPAMPEAQHAAHATGNGDGAALFAGACATCHEAGGPLAFSATVPLEAATSLHHAAPDNVIRVILGGVEQPLAPGVPLMPGFAGILNDTQLTSVITYMRARFTDEPSWEGVEEEVNRIRDDELQPREEAQ